MAVGLGRAVPSVLVVEDDATVRRFLAENLIADRFAPMSAGSAEEASPCWPGPGRTRRSSTSGCPA